MSIYQELSECEKKGIPVVLCSIVASTGSTPRHPGSKMLVYSDGHTSGTIGGGELESIITSEALASLKNGKPKLIPYSYSSDEKDRESLQTGSVEVYVEPLQPKVTLVVVGGGHVGQKVVFLSRWLDFRVIVSDERADFSTPSIIPGADEYICCKLSEIPSKISVNSNTYFVLTTKNADIDIEGLPSLLKTDTPYIGVIGSKRRWNTTMEALINLGVGTDQFSRIHSPIGLDLHAETPQEIAISILSEVILQVNSSREKTIHS